MQKEITTARTPFRRWIMRARTRWMVTGLMVAAAPLVAQQGPGARGPQGRGMGPMGPGVERNIEVALSRAETLGLGEARVQELRAMQEELARVREGLGKDVEAFRQETRRQDRDLREARRAQAQSLREKRQEALQPFQQRYEGLLTEAQRTQIRQWARDDGARRGGGSMAPGRSTMQRGGRGSMAPGRPAMQRGGGGSMTPGRSAMQRGGVRAVAPRRGPGSGIW